MKPTGFIDHKVTVGAQKYIIRSPFRLDAQQVIAVLSLHFANPDHPMATLGKPMVVYHIQRPQEGS